MSSFLWRKYACGIPAVLFTGQPWEELERSIVIWPAVEAWQYPALNRWQRLEGAFAGFVSEGLAEPHACAYYADKVLEIAKEKIVSKVWIDGADAAEAYEWITCNLLDVWLGNKTPYLITGTQNFEEILKNWG